MNMLSKILMIALLAGLVSDGHVLAMDVDGCKGSGSVVVDIPGESGRPLDMDLIRKRRADYQRRKAAGEVLPGRKVRGAKRDLAWEDDGMPYDQGNYCGAQDTPEPSTKRPALENHAFQQGVVQHNPYMDVLTAMQQFSDVFVGEVSQCNLFSEDKFDEGGNIESWGTLEPYNAALNSVFNCLSEIFNDDVAVDRMYAGFMGNYESLVSAFASMRSALIQAGHELDADEVAAGYGDVVDRAITALDNLNQKLSDLHEILQQEGADISILGVMRAFAKSAAEQCGGVAVADTEDDEF